MRPGRSPTSRRPGSGRSASTHPFGWCCFPERALAPRSCSAQLLDPHQVAGRISYGAVADAVRLLGGLLDDLGIVGLEPLERRVEVAGPQEDPAVGALRHHLRDGATL